MRSAFDSGFARTVAVTDETGTRNARAFLRPLSLKDPEGPALCPAGPVDARRWLLLMEPLALRGTVTLCDGGTEYRLLRWETIGGGDHIEGLLCRKGGGGNAE